MAKPQSTDKALVRNAADAEQVKRAAKQEQFTREDELNDLRVVLSSYEGRRFLWRWLGTLGVNKSVFVTSAEIYYRAGQQDAGHRLMAEILEAEPDGYLLMQKEAVARDRATVEPNPKVAHDEA